MVNKTIKKEVHTHNSITRGDHFTVLFCVLPYCVPYSRMPHQDHKVIRTHLSQIYKQVTEHKSCNEEHSFSPLHPVNISLVISRHHCQILLSLIRWKTQHGATVKSIPQEHIQSPGPHRPTEELLFIP